jgi:hypothetical protein
MEALVWPIVLQVPLLHMRDVRGGHLGTQPDLAHLFPRVRVCSGSYFRRNKIRIVLERQLRRLRRLARPVSARAFSNHP